ncbi:MAG: hypothetical protein HYY25_10265 [Candidatus Wallbacteria bacterium]|nr:hypothetical protein [Candidatus Wallbacteria bacterium]
MGAASPLAGGLRSRVGSAKFPNPSTLHSPPSSATAATLGSGASRVLGHGLG